jgi:opacity protein-like surface antigen
MTRSLVTTFVLLAASVLGSVSAVLPASASDDPDAIRARDDRIAHLESTLETVVDELARLRDQVAVPDEPELVSSYGLGPAASKIYGVERGLSIGGYGEANYRTFVDDKNGRDLDRADFLRMVLYFGYKFTDRIVFNSEIEFEHGTTSDVKNGSGGGSASVEFATLDFLLHEKVNARAGMLLVPMGFVNEIHEPPFYYGVQRPETETRILPSTWRENGVGLFGNLSESLEYRLYAVTGFNGSRFSDSGVRSGRQNGNRSLAEDWAGVLRLDWRPEAIEGLLLGGSVYYGEADQDYELIAGVDVAETEVLIGELHLQYRNGPFHMRSLLAYTDVSNAGELSVSLGRAADAPVAGAMLGGYVEAAVDVWSMLFGNHARQLEPFLRVEYVDTQRSIPTGFTANRNRSFWLYNPGVQFHPHPNVVLKLEYRNFDPHEGEMPDEVAVGMGFAF